MRCAKTTASGSRAESLIAVSPVGTPSSGNEKLIVVKCCVKEAGRAESSVCAFYTWIYVYASKIVC